MYSLAKYSDSLELQKLRLHCTNAGLGAYKLCKENFKNIWKKRKQLKTQNI